MLHKNAKNNSSRERVSEKQKEIEGFNIYFTTIGKILSNKLIDLGKNGRQKRTSKSMFLTSTNEAKISLVIKKLKNKYSTDCDGLNNFILKK